MSEPPVVFKVTVKLVASIALTHHLTPRVSVVGVNITLVGVDPIPCACVFVVAPDATVTLPYKFEEAIVIFALLSVGSSTPDTAT